MYWFIMKMFPYVSDYLIAPNVIGFKLTCMAEHKLLHILAYLLHTGTQCDSYMPLMKRNRENIIAIGTNWKL